MADDTKTAVFVLRLWQETDEGDRRWRGTVQHVGSSTRVHVETLAQITSFIEHWTAADLFAPDTSQNEH